MSLAAVAIVLSGRSPAKASAGVLDPTFGVGGKVTSDFGGSDGANEVAIQPDGKIVVVGFGGSSAAFAVARYNPDGTLDPSFGAAGKVTTRFMGGDSALSVVLQPDGKLVAAGCANCSATSSDFALARYNPNGSLDATFGNGGKVTTNFVGYDKAYGVAIQTDGRILVAGYAAIRHGSNGDFALARYNPNGTLDASFGTAGRVITNVSNGSFPADDRASALALQPDGKIVAAGYANWDGYRSSFGLARYNSNGTLDQSFGTGGKVISFAGYSVAYDVALQADGRIVAAGESNRSGDTRFTVARYGTDGTLDPNFGSGARNPPLSANPAGIAFSLALQPDGRVVAAGANLRGTDFVVARYGADGFLDQSFGTFGQLSTDFSGGSDSAFSVAIQTDGSVVAAGQSSGASSADFAVARYFLGVVCDSTSSPMTGLIPETLIVPAGTKCVLEDADVRGNVVVRGELNATRTLVQGDLVIESHGAKSVLRNADISGNVVLRGVAGDALRPQLNAAWTRVRGNLQALQFFNVYMDFQSVVDGDVALEQGGFWGFGSSTIHGSFLASDTTNFDANGVTLTFKSSLGGMEIGRNLTIERHTGRVELNSLRTVRGDVEFRNNNGDYLIDDSGWVAPIGGSLSVIGNTGSGTITRNRVAGALHCENNTSVSGSGNTAAGMEGQCQGF